jgi:DNA-directed RNA polymerase sigma subunit (sigma70/sigma32)
METYQNSLWEQTLTRLRKEFASDPPVCLYLDALEKAAAEPAEKTEKERLTESGLLSVVTIAAEYRGKGVHILDLFQAGNEGLRQAVETYDRSCHGDFSDYASGKIRRSIEKTLVLSCTDRPIPEELHRK